MMFGCNSGVFNNYQYTYSKCLKPPALLVNGRPRFNENEQCLEWLRAWRKTVSNRKDLQASDRNKMFLSEKTMFDVSSTIIGF